MNFKPPGESEIKSLFPKFQEVRFLKAGGFKAVYKVIVNGIPEAFKIVHIPEETGVELPPSFVPLIIRVLQQFSPE